MRRAIPILLVALAVAGFTYLSACTPPNATVEGRSNDGLFAIIADPSSAEVYVDGQFMGKARRFDGSPGYLQIASGTHRLELRKDGYKTWVRDVYSSNAIQEIRVTLSKIAAE